MNVQHEWKYGFVRGEVIDGSAVAEDWADLRGYRPGEALLADELLRVVARLREAEKLLREVEWGGNEDSTYCRQCGRFEWRGHSESCPVHRFLSEQSAAPPAEDR